MIQNDLYEAVRKEDVVIFAGAGFSKYAGYPLGGQLTKMIFHALTKDEQAKVNEHWPLDDLAEEVVRIKEGSRSLLNKILDDTFDVAPRTTVDHDTVAAISHFRTIITTNYDRLFENAYGDDATMIFKELDIVKYGGRWVDILKIHGDLSEKETIVLTREDYSKFYRKDYSSPFWSTITKLIATKTILFLGYGYEDPNVWAIFQHIYSYLGNNRKAAYFVGPGVRDDKIKFLKDRNIRYIDSTAETFLGALIQNIKNNIFKDLENRWINAETFRRFTRQHRIAVGLIDTGDGFKIQSIKGRDGVEMRGHMNFSISPDSDFPERYKAFFEKGQTEELILDAKELTSFWMDVEGLKLYGEGELHHLSIKKTPKIIPFDMVFSAEGFEVRNLTAQIYTGKKSINIKSKLHTLNFEFTIDYSNLNDLDAKWSMEHDAIYRNIAEEIEVHQFLKYFFSQKNVTIYIKDGGSFTKQCPTYNASYIAQSETYLAYFAALKEVEKAFGVRFTDFYPIDQESVDDLNWITKVIRGERFPKGDKIELSFSNISAEIIENLDKLKSTVEPMEITMNTDLVMLLHGQRLPVPGVHIEIPMPEVTNVAQIKSGKSRKMKLKSRSGMIYERYMLEAFPRLD